MGDCHRSQAPHHFASKRTSSQRGLIRSPASQTPPRFRGCRGRCSADETATIVAVPLPLASVKGSQLRLSTTIDPKPAPFPTPALAAGSFASPPPPQAVSIAALTSVNVKMVAAQRRRREGVMFICRGATSVAISNEGWRKHSGLCMEVSRSRSSILFRTWCFKPLQLGPIRTRRFLAGRHGRAANGLRRARQPARPFRVRRLAAFHHATRWRPCRHVPILLDHGSSERHRTGHWRCASCRDAAGRPSGSAAEAAP